MIGFRNVLGCPHPLLCWPIYRSLVPFVYCLPDYQARVFTVDGGRLLRYYLAELTGRHPYIAHLIAQGLLWTLLPCIALTVLYLIFLGITIGITGKCPEISVRLVSLERAGNSDKPTARIQPIGLRQIAERVSRSTELGGTPGRSQ